MKMHRTATTDYMQLQLPSMALQTILLMMTYVAEGGDDLTLYRLFILFFSNVN